MVIDAGRVAEFGKPLDLLCKSKETSVEVDNDTLFARLVK
jgi:hypothetical protein